MRWLSSTLICFALTGLTCGPGVDPTRLDGGGDGQVISDGDGPDADGDPPAGDPGDPADADAGTSDASADLDVDPVCTWSALTVS